MTQTPCSACRGTGWISVGLHGWVKCPKCVSQARKERRLIWKVRVTLLWMGVWLATAAWLR